MRLLRLANLLGIHLVLSCQLVAAAGPQSQTPVIINAPASARGGDIVGLQGDGFGTSPQVVLENADGTLTAPLETINTWRGNWVAARLPASVSGAMRLHVRNGEQLSDVQVLNAPHPYHLDAMQIVPGGAFRLFGRNLLSAGSNPSVTVNMLPAQVRLESSEEHMLSVVAPTGLKVGEAAQIRINNNNGSGWATLDREISIGPGGDDVFGLGVGWAGAFAALVRRVVLADSDPRLTKKALCDGLHDDTAAIQTGVDLIASGGGGLLQLPAGICRLHGSVKLRSRVILQGAGKDSTKLRYENNYPIDAHNIELAAVRNMTLENAVGPIESPITTRSSKVAWQNIRFKLGGGIQMYMTFNQNIAIEGCDILQPLNSQKNGPLILTYDAGLTFTNNKIIFANGSPFIGYTHDTFFGHNQLSRDMQNAQNTEDIVHSLAMDFAYRVAIIDNHFNIINGPVTNLIRNDGETLLTEGGGANRTEQIGTVKNATRTSLLDPDFHPNRAVLANINIPENYGIVIVGGKGTGQHRQIISVDSGTVTVDKPWSVVPDNSSRYAAAMWGLEKSIILRNTLEQNPRGITFYRTAVREVDIVDNIIYNGGGISLNTAQNLKSNQFTPMYDIRVSGNQFEFNEGAWPPYICLAFVRMDEYDFGIAAISIEIRNNVLRTNLPKVTFPQELICPTQAYSVRMSTEGPSKERSKIQSRLLGTVIQNNQCIGCEAGYLIREGAQATVQEGNR